MSVVTTGPPPGLRVLLDDAGDGSGMLAMPATGATAEGIAALVRHGSGFLFVTLSAATASRLGLPGMRGADGVTDMARPADRHRVSVDAAAGLGTGISALDRARTASLLADPATLGSDLTRPGHVVPVVVDTGNPRSPADRVHLAFGAPAVFAAVPGGPGGTGLATGEELLVLARHLAVPLVRTGDTAGAPGWHHLLTRIARRGHPVTVVG